MTSLHLYPRCNASPVLCRQMRRSLPEVAKVLPRHDATLNLALRIPALAIPTTTSQCQ